MTLTNALDANCPAWECQSKFHKIFSGEAIPVFSLKYLLGDTSNGLVVSTLAFCFAKTHLNA